MASSALAQSPRTSNTTMPRGGSLEAARAGNLQRSMQQARQASFRAERPPNIHMRAPTEKIGADAGMAARRANHLRSQTGERPQVDERLLEEQAEQAEIQAVMQAARIAEATESEEDDTEESRQSTQNSLLQKKAQDVAKQNIPRGAAFVANGLAAALDLGTAGVAFLIDIFVYAFTLGFFNVQMIYGGWIAKGKSPIIPPLKWDPIPMPVDKSGIILQGLVIMANLMVIIAFVVIFAILALVLLLLFAPTLVAGHFGFQFISSFF